MAWCCGVGKSYEGTTHMCMCKVDFSWSDFGELEMLIDKRCQDLPSKLRLVRQLSQIGSPQLIQF